MLRPELGDIAVVALFSAVVGVLGLATPLAVEALVNTVSFGRLVQPLVVLSIILFGFLGFGAALKSVQIFVAELIQRRLFVRVVAELSYRLPRVDQRAFDGRHAPELLNRFFDVMTVQKSAALLVLEGLALVLKTLIGMAVLGFYHPLLLSFDIFLLAILSFVVFVLGRGATRTAIQESRAKYAVAAWLEELALHSLTFRGHGGPRHALERADALTADYLEARGSHFRVVLRQAMFAFGMQAVSGSLLLAIGGWLVMQGKINLGQLVAAELIVAVIVDTFAKLNKHAESFYDLLAATEKIGHLLDLPCERSQGERLAREELGMAVRLHRAGLVLDERSAALHEVDWTLSPGDQVVIADGRSAQASLLLDLLFAARQTTTGYVTVDGADLRTLDPHTYREQTALVRNVELFTGTLAENVHLNRAESPDLRVREALMAVGLWERVLELPQGTETPLQPSGGLLTVGEERRLMLARALFGSPRLLLIDGLLDALPDVELPVVLHTLQALPPKCTVVIATGREDIRREFHPMPLVPSPDAPSDEAPARLHTGLQGAA